MMQDINALDLEKAAALRVVPWNIKGVFKSGYFEANGMVSIDTVLSGEFSSQASAFDKNLHCSPNLCPKFEDTSFWGKITGTQTSYQPFKVSHKPYNQMLIIKDKDTGALDVMLLDQNDAKEMRDFMSSDSSIGPDPSSITCSGVDIFYDPPKPTFTQGVYQMLSVSNDPNARPLIRSVDSKTSRLTAMRDPNSRWRDHILGVYDLNTASIHAQGKEEFDIAALKADPKFKLLETQALFFRGEVNYSKTQLEILEEWLTKAGVDKMQALFKDWILPWAGVSLIDYDNGNIAELFERIAPSSDSGLGGFLFG
jgi:hypothetical protein